MAEDKVAKTTAQKSAKDTGNKLVTGAEYDSVVKSYNEGKMKPGYGLSWKTSGGTTKPVVTKLGK